MSKVVREERKEKQEAHRLAQYAVVLAKLIKNKGEK